MPDQTTTPSPLETALAEACQFAIAHGVDAVTPADFGIQRTDIGLTNATYVDGDHAVVVTVDRHGNANFGVARLNWVHLEADEDRDICDHCEVIDPRDIADERPIDTAYLPGGAPVSEPTHV